MLSRVFWNLPPDKLERWGVVIKLLRRHSRYEQEEDTTFTLALPRSLFFNLLEDLNISKKDVYYYKTLKGYESYRIVFIEKEGRFSNMWPEDDSEVATAIDYINV